MQLGGLSGAVEERLAEFERDRYAARMWAHDPTRWKPDVPREIVDRLGWLHAPWRGDELLDQLNSLASDAVSDGITDVVLLGMGGSSLAPEMFMSTFGALAGHPRLTVVDSTHPDAIRSVTDRIDLASTWFVVSSKSGGTIETLSLFRYFWAKVSAAVPDPGRQFLAITDPGSGLASLAADRIFRATVLADPEVGGRFSALAAFGLVPAALIGIDVPRLLTSAKDMALASAADVPASENPGLALGAVIGEAARHGRDKLTLLVSESLRAFPAWAEQLVAESTGKEGTGVLPVAGEPAGDPAGYSDDRLFLALLVEHDADYDHLSRAVNALSPRHPVVRIDLMSPWALAGELVRAEIATAVSGTLLGINPFDQPDVQVAKIMAQRAMAGELDTSSVGEPVSAGPGWIDALDVADGGYVALQAYVPQTAEAEAALAEVQAAVRSRTGAATTAGFGPRFLHSTGQYHKGGPDHGVCVQLVDSASSGDRPGDLPIPESDSAFSDLIAAQAAGDAAALTAAGQQVVRLRVDGIEEINALAAG